MIIFLLFVLSKGGIMELPQPVQIGEVSVEECIAKRRSVRAYSSKPLTLKELSQLLWAAQGITDPKGLRTAPSAGATYPLEIRAVTREGIFHYIPEGHKLIKEQSGDLRPKLARAASGQSFIKEVPCNFVISCVYERTTMRYKERGIRYVHIEAGHVAENIHLQAVALGLGSVPVGAFWDSEVKELLNLPKNEEPIYIIPVGHPK
ncbi:SagB/ThcOx family dehydrogenase [candidate division WOR-3 bacterium]|nr:SagB/ThcOx family dehydrogenase [candidate division WOR-3 bacterium]